MSEQNPSILSHVSIGTNQFERAVAFYDKVLATLGCKRVLEHPGAVAWGREYPEFWVQTPIDGQPANVGNGTHFGFVAPDKASVHAFHEAALAAGGQDEGQQIDIQPLQLTVLVLHAKGRPEVGHHP